jgi:hypothetical protein
MAQPQESRITCGQCNGWYNSETELRNHMQTVHRRFVPEQSTFQHGGPKPDSFEDQLRKSKEEWTKLSLQLRNLVQARFNPEELDAIDRFILLASQGSVFDHICR